MLRCDAVLGDNGSDEVCGVSGMLLYGAMCLHNICRCGVL